MPIVSVNVPCLGTYIKVGGYAEKSINFIKTIDLEIREIDSIETVGKFVSKKNNTMSSSINSIEKLVLTDNGIFGFKKEERRQNGKDVLFTLEEFEKKLLSVNHRRTNGAWNNILTILGQPRKEIVNLNIKEVPEVKEWIGDNSEYKRKILQKILDDNFLLYQGNILQKNPANIVLTRNEISSRYEKNDTKISLWKMPEGIVLPIYFIKTMSLIVNHYNFFEQDKKIEILNNNRIMSNPSFYINQEKMQPYVKPYELSEFFHFFHEQVFKNENFKRKQDRKNIQFYWDISDKISELSKECTFDDFDNMLVEMKDRIRKEKIVFPYYNMEFLEKFLSTAKEEYFNPEKNIVLIDVDNVNNIKYIDNIKNEQVLTL